MAILGGCAICGRTGCTSQRHRDGGPGIREVASSKRGLPLANYVTPVGEHLRLNEPDARRLGLIGPEPIAEPEIAVEPETAPVNRRAGEVLAWAGDDPVRLREALDAERAGKARVTLVAELERRLE